MLRNVSECGGVGTNVTGGLGQSLHQGIELWHTYLLFILLGVVGLGLAKLFNTIRERIYEEKVCCHIACLV